MSEPTMKTRMRTPWTIGYRWPVQLRVPEMETSENPSTDPGSCKADTDAIPKTDMGTDIPSAGLGSWRKRSASPYRDPAHPWRWTPWYDAALGDAIKLESGRKFATNEEDDALALRKQAPHVCLRRLWFPRSQIPFGLWPCPISAHGHRWGFHGHKRVLWDRTKYQLYRQGVNYRCTKVRWQLQVLCNPQSLLRPPLPYLRQIFNHS